jgi:hypothetical protein
MRAVISHYHDAALCTWCNRNAEGVTIEFDGGFLQKGPLCWKCLMQAARVHHMQMNQHGQKTNATIKARPEGVN